MRKFVLLFLAVLVTGASFAQNRQVSGTVTTLSGNPIIGATIVVEGTTTAGITNNSGQFTISAPANGTLSISFIGYNSQQISIEGRSSIDIVMTEHIEAIDDVIVVAFGTAKREAFTGSAAVVSAESLEKRQTTNVLDALVGSVPGLQMRGSKGQPGDNSSTISIRGISSLGYAGSEPLVILDGAPYSASLANIPQSDIESVTVLKDAASAALYGARGATGVIIVTTKRAKSNDAIINVDMKWGVNSRALQNYDMVSDPGEYYEAYFTQLYNSNRNVLGMSVGAATAQSNKEMLQYLQYDVFSRPEGEWLVGSNGKLNPKATLGRKYTFDGTDYWLTSDNWTKEAYKNNMRQEYSVSVNGGSDRMSYYSSLSYLNDGGIVEFSSYERIAARLKADYQAKKWLKVGANIGYTHSVQDSNSNWGTDAGSSNLFTYTSGMGSIYPLYVRVLDKNGNPVIATDEYGHKVYDYGVASMGGYKGLSRPYLGTGNPIGENQYNSHDVNSNQLNGTFTADVNLTDFLKANATSTVTWGQSNTSRFGNMFYGTPAVSGGYIEKTGAATYRTNNIQSLTYFDTFGRHNVNAMAGHEFYKETRNRLWARGQGMFSPDIQELDGAALSHADANSNTTTYNVEGYFLNAQYNYDDKYYASASYRRDGSSNFHPDHRWGNFWSVGGAWILSKESFMPQTTWIDMLKLKASIGQLGNDNIGDFGEHLYADSYNIVNSGDNIHMSPTFAAKGNPNITWETTTSFNAGVEFSLFHGRFSGVIDIYRKKTTDMLFWMSVPESAGYPGMWENIGDVRYSGIEASLSGSVIHTRNVEWVLSANFTHERSKILSLPASKIIGGNNGFVESDPTRTQTFWYRVGGPMYNAYMVEFAGLNEEGLATFYIDLKDKNGNVIAHKGDTTTDFSLASEDARYEQGSMLPDLYGGFGTSLRVKDFDMSIQFDYQIGGKVYDGYYANTVSAHPNANGAGTSIHKDWKKSWSSTNTGSSLPRWQFGDRFAGSRSTRYLTSASYLNFQSFSVGYTVPESLLKNVVKIRVYVAGENLHFWSARKGLDPRYAFIGNGTILDYSPMRTVSGGVQLTF